MDDYEFFLSDPIFKKEFNDLLKKYSDDIELVLQSSEFINILVAVMQRMNDEDNPDDDGYDSGDDDYSTPWED
jgi:hypothetical protein